MPCSTSGSDQPTGRKIDSACLMVGLGNCWMYSSAALWDAFSLRTHCMLKPPCHRHQLPNPRIYTHHISQAQVKAGVPP